MKKLILFILFVIILGVISQCEMKNINKALEKCNGNQYCELSILKGV